MAHSSSAISSAKLANYQRVLFGAIIFTGAFLLFQIQPVISKYMLPWFGGSSAVWTTAMLFFQVGLVGGYAYAFLSNKYLSPRTQAIVHIVLLLLAVLVLPIAPGEQWKPSATDDPTSHILALLAANIGLVYLLLAATSPLVQTWFRRAYPNSSPYRLYALSNVGSLLGLVSYPFIVEPLFTLETQLATWSWGFLIFVALSALGSLISLGGVSEAAAIEVSKSEKRKRTRKKQAKEKNAPRYVWALWLALSAAAVVMLLAVTNQVTQEVAVIPFLWVLPLSLYLLSLIICFENEKYYSRKVFIPLLPVAAIAIAILLAETPGDVDIRLQIGVYAAALFVICMVCHGELVHLKPRPERLTGFYLLVAIGGAGGGILVGLVAPLIFDGFLEMHYGVIATFALILVALYVNANSGLHQGRPIWLWGLLLTSFVIPSSMILDNLPPHAGVRETRRNFYGVFWIYEERSGGPENYHDAMVSAGTQHGHQYIAPERQCRPTTYYGEESGVGLALRYLPGEGEFRVGAVGLGVGTIASYISDNSYIRFYEINPDVIEVAQDQFSFLACASQVDVILGDARLVLEQEAAQDFDLFVLDAFRGDAIPLHLLTREAFEIYMRHLKPDGTIIVHTSNAHLNYAPVLAGLAEHFNLETMLVEADGADGKSRFSNDWVTLTNNRELLVFLAANGGLPLKLSTGEQARLWTDNYSNLYQILK